MSTIIPADRMERNPLITSEGHALLNRILQHAGAPKWNYVVGDRIGEDDLAAFLAYREGLFARGRSWEEAPTPALVERLLSLRDRVASIRERVPHGTDIARDWALIPTAGRDEVAIHPERLVPEGEDLSRLIYYETSGTTGHALKVPHHPRAQAMNHALMEFALARHGVRLNFGQDRVACFNVGAQEQNTVVFACVFSVWNQAGFAKVNLHPRDWRGVGAARRFFADLAPQFLTGDPVGFAEIIGWELPVRPAAIVSTAVALSHGLKAELGSRFGCPVIDWYSVTETGPVAYSCPRGEGLHILPHDIFVEVLDGAGDPVAPGGRGEIVVSGGRNPFLPLLRYRTGDFGRMDISPCRCGDPLPKILDLEGRQAVLFRAPDGSVVNAVDLGRALRKFPVVQHEVVQRSDGSCDVALRPAPGCDVDPETVRSALGLVLGPAIPVRVRFDETLGERLGGGKVQAFRSEIPE